MNTEAYVTLSETSPFELTPLRLRPVGPTEVRVKFTCCGLCHTDHHMAVNDWKITTYPVVPGHEGVGVVAEKGAAVRSLEVGDKVGVGWISGSCEGCPKCLKGEENICGSGYNGTYLGENNMGGCFAREQVVNSRFSYKIPKGLPHAVAAPLLCAGITVYSPLRKFVQANMSVGIISVGGLGHLAVQFAKAMGAEVTVFSTSTRKEGEARSFGASKFVVTKDPEQMKAATGTCDVILNCCPYKIDLDPFVDCLATDGVLVFLGIPENDSSDIKIDLYKLIFSQRTLAGSIVGGSRYMVEMFEFALKHRIVPSVQCVPFESINDTVVKLLKGEMDGFYR
ncbi:MAG: hypothetical protein KVP17_003396, partial [Porospora cf. gigantea B]